MTSRSQTSPGGSAIGAGIGAGVAAAGSFAEAQRRLAVRRQQRQQQERRGGGGSGIRTIDSAIDSTSNTAVSRVYAALPASVRSSPFLQRIGNTALVAWDAGRRVVRDGGDSSSSPPPAFRVSQVDAELLDEELLGLLRAQVADALRYLRGGTLTDDWAPEIMLVLRAALFKLSVWDHDATYGAALQNLRFADARKSTSQRSGGDRGVPVAPSRWQKAAYGLITVGGRYAWTKWEDWLRTGDDDDDDEHNGQTGVGRFGRSRPMLTRLTERLGDAYAAAALVSFLVFLRHGRYRTLLDRLLGLRLVPPTSQVSREVSFEYLNRQLVWHAFTEFLLFVLPLVGIQRWRRWAARFWRRTKSAASQARAVVTGGGKEAGSASVPEPTGELAFLPERTCAICYQEQNQGASSEAEIMAAAASSGVVGSAETDITNPYETVPCGCIYCYVCVATAIEREEGDGWSCLRCGAVATACRPWNGDVLEPAVAATAAATTTATTGTAATTTAATTTAVIVTRPTSSASAASPSFLRSPHKTVGFAADVKGDDDEDDGPDGYDGHRDNGDDTSTPDSGIGSDSEAYEEEEEAMGDDGMEL